MKKQFFVLALAAAGAAMAADAVGTGPAAEMICSWREDKNMKRIITITTIP